MMRIVKALGLSLCSVFVGSVFVGCGGSQPPAEAPSSAEPVAETAPVDASDGSAADAAGADESWEGEAEATGGSDGSGGDGGPASGGATETRTTEVIAKTVKDNRKAFRDCYEKGAKDLPGLEGTMTLHFVLDPEGKVRTAELNLERSTIKAPAVVDCAVAVLKGMKFPPSSRGMDSTVNYPFDFKR